MVKKLFGNFFSDEKKTVQTEKVKIAIYDEVTDSYDPKKPSEYDSKARCRADRSFMIQK